MEHRLGALRLLVLAALDVGCGSLCKESTPILDASGTATGFERCADGAIHRASIEPVDPTIDAAACDGTEIEQSCSTDADCDDGPNGKCISGVSNDYGYYESVTACDCAYACASDAECDDGEVCLPVGVVETGDAWSACIAASCAQDADCASGECGLGAYDDGCAYWAELQCRLPDDECRSDDDWDDDESCAVHLFDSDFECNSVECAIGRPLLVGREPRTAPAAVRDDWAGPAGPDTTSLSPGSRRTLRDHWRRVAASEHASVGSFARFTLQLLALGSPPGLLADTQAAAADEVRHARFAWTMARAAGDRAVGPGPLALGDAAPRLDWEGVVRGLIDEACVSETLGAAEAAELLASAVAAGADPAVVDGLAAVAADEARHAALAWRALAWLVGGAPARERVHAWLTLAVERAEVSADRLASRPATDAALAAFGLVSDRTRAATHRAALDHVVRPAVVALIASDCQ